VPNVVDLFTDTDEWVRHGAVTALGEFSKQRE